MAFNSFPIPTADSALNSAQGVAALQKAHLLQSKYVVAFKTAFNEPAFDYSILNETQLTVSISSTSASTIASGVLIARDAYADFELLSTRESYIGESAGYATSQAPSGANIPVVQGFYYDGSEIEFQFRHLQGQFHVISDGKIVSTGDLGSVLNQPRWFKINLGVARLRKIYLVSYQALRGGITIEPSTNFYATRTEQPSIGVLGDSITAGSGSTNALNFTSALRWKLNSFDTASYGIGGSGYINNTGSGKFIDRLQEVYDAGHDYLMTAGGINDLSSSVSDFSTAVDAYYAAALLLFPADKIIIVSNWTNSATLDATATTQFRDVLEAKATSIGAFFIDAIRTQALGGYVTNANKYQLEDGTHPNNDMTLLYGHNIAASMMGENLRL